MIPASGADGWIYLATFLAPVADLFERGDVSDIHINRPGEVWIETVGGAVERLERPALDEATLARLARQIASYSNQGISREHPLLSASLPDGSRVQIVAPPATRGPLALSIRKHVNARMTLADYQADNAFGTTSTRKIHGPTNIDRALREQLQSGDVEGTLRSAVRARKTIMVSGGTSTGKTTFLNALLGEVPPDERLILIEDTPELQVNNENYVGLLAARSALGETVLTSNDLVAASLRMRPDRIIVGELRGPEAFAFLRAINTGHPGSMSTVHADSPEGAIEQIALLVLQQGVNLSRTDIRDYVRSIVGVFVQLSREGGRRFVSEVILAE